MPEEVVNAIIIGEGADSGGLAADSNASEMIAPVVLFITMSPPRRQPEGAQDAPLLGDMLPDTSSVTVSPWALGAPTDDLTIGDRVLVNLHHGRKEEAVIKSITPTTGGKKFQVDFGNDQTALVADWQIMGKST